MILVTELGGDVYYDAYQQDGMTKSQLLDMLRELPHGAPVLISSDLTPEQHGHVNRVAVTNDPIPMAVLMHRDQVAQYQWRQWAQKNGGRTRKW